MLKMPINMCIDFTHHIPPFTMKYQWCGGENQLSHYDWAGNFHPNLPPRCRLAEGLNFELKTNIAGQDGRARHQQLL